MRRRLHLLIAVGLGLFGGLAVLVFWGFAQFTRPGPLAQDTTIIIDRGGVEQVTRVLVDAGVVEHPLVFALAVRLTGAAGRLKSGEYLFPARIAMEDVSRLLQSGKTVDRKLVVLEGMTTAEVLRLLTGQAGFTGAAAAAGEGELMPATYYYKYGDARPWMIQRMKDEQRQMVQELWAKRAQGLPFASAREAITLASIVEKETARASERARVAGVFINRLNKGMKLEADPTVAYAAANGQGRLDRPISKTDLAMKHPYNTYQVTGLPPGPIGNPGRAALAAVLNPDKHEDLFFVADGSGGHAFAKTLAEHQKNVARWRQIEQQRNGQAPATAPALARPSQAAN
ncbi:MAG: endolytic transglycosylase MltG [Alphaproteobacteria bacterium]|nr:endolytic transglycosylase MltG [Alphaproteobacteria bacterium]